MAFIIREERFTMHRRNTISLPGKRYYKKHMWPLTISAVPMCREAWIVTMADKWCSLMETFHVHKGHGALIEKLRKIEEEQGK